MVARGYFETFMKDTMIKWKIKVASVWWHIYIRGTGSAARTIPTHPDRFARQPCSTTNANQYNEHQTIWSCREVPQFHGHGTLSKPLALPVRLQIAAGSVHVLWWWGLL